MVSKKVMVVNEEGLHMRPAGKLSKAVAAHKGCNVTLNANDRAINGKSVMQIMAAGMKKGCQVEIVCEGEDEQAVLDEITEMFEAGFGE